MANSRLSILADKYASDLFLPLSTIATGGSKAVAAMQALGGIIVTKVLGPLGAVAYAVVGIVGAMRNWEQAAQLVGRAMEKAAAKEALTKQFAELTKGVATAKARIEDLIKFSQSSPFNFQSIIEGGKALAAVSKGALASSQTLKLVGDAAAASGQQFSTVATAVAGLYSDLKGGRPVKESADALKELGVFSQSTVDQLVSMQTTGAGLASTFGVVTKALEGSKGAMASMVQTVDELRQKQDELKAGILTPAGQIFNDAQKQGIQNANALLEKLAPTLSLTAQAGARVSTIFGYLQNSIVGMISRIPYLGQALGIAILGFTTFAAAVLAVSGVRLTAWLVSSTVAMLRYAAATGEAAAAQVALNAAQGSIGRAQLSGAFSTARAVAAGEEGATATQAASMAVSGLKNVTVAAAATAGRAGLGLLGSALTYVGEGILALLTPLNLAIAALTALGVAGLAAYTNFESGVKAVNDMRDATEESAASFQKQATSVKTAADAANLYAAAVQNVKNAQDNLSTVKGQASNVRGASTDSIIAGMISGKYKGASGIGTALLDLAASGYNSLSNTISGQGDKEVAAQAGVAQAGAQVTRAAQIQQKTDFALPDDINDQRVQAVIQNQQINRQAQLNNPNLGVKERADLLTTIADAAKEEFIQKVATQKDLQEATTPIGRMAVLDSSKSAEMRAQGVVENLQANGGTPAEIQDAQNNVKEVAASLGDFAQKMMDATAAILAFNQSAAKMQAQVNEDFNDATARDLRVKGDAAIQGGDLAGGRQKQGQAQSLELDAEESRRTREIMERLKALGVNSDDAQKQASSQAKQERGETVLESFLSKQRDLARLTIQTPVGPYAPNTANYYTAEEAAAGRGAGFGVSDNQVQKQKGPPPGFIGPWQDPDAQLGGPSPLDNPESATHHGIGGLGHEGLGPATGVRHYTMGDILGPTTSKPMGTSEPILTENQKQTQWLEKIFNKLPDNKAAATKSI